MLTEDLPPDVSDASDLLAQLVAFEGAPQQFWRLFLRYTAEVIKARTCMLATCPEGGSWSQLAIWPSEGPDSDAGAREAFRRAIPQMAPEVVRAGAAAQEMKVPGYRVSGTLLGACIPMLIHGMHAVVFVRTDERMGELRQASSLALLRQVAALPATYQVRAVARQARTEAARFGQTLDLLALLYDEKRFVAAAMLLCNELAGRFACERVSLGWVKGDYIRLQAMSHAENFQKRMQAVRQLETAMEEAYDQDEEILWPAPPDSASIAREHEALAREQGVHYIASVPLRAQGEVCGVLLFERSAPAFSDSEVGHIRLLADQISCRLWEIHARDRWFGARCWSAVQRGVAFCLGPRHAMAKLAAILGSIILIFFCFFPVPFRIQAPFVIRTETSLYLPAPFDGFLAAVHVEPGDIVDAGQVLLEMDTREMILEEIAANADQLRYLRESEKARAEGRPADMRIAEAQAEQARVRLELTRHRLRQAGLTASYDSVVLEGDLKDRIGAPLRQGDTLMRLARLDELYVSLDIDQRDIHAVMPQARVRFAFASRPGYWFEGELERIDPLAQARERKTFFPAKCRIQGEDLAWMRPGMTGLSKIDAGQRPLVWIATRRTLDFIRLHLWW